ncbi:MAG: flagellar biosynthetic protein FliR [Gammaproteobacteria bacterium]
MNIFAVGFPITLLLGMLLIWITFPNVLDHFDGILSDAYDLTSELLRL